MRLASFWRRRRCCETPNSPRPNVIWTGFGKAGPRRSGPPRFILTCYATCAEFIRISAAWPIPCSTLRASWRGGRTQKASWSISPSQAPFHRLSTAEGGLEIASGERDRLFTRWTADQDGRGVLFGVGASESQAGQFLPVFCR